ncbi:lysophospholipid acyltransferase family protein [candidate division KSB1 bacterium]|nr:lysophospholipid acyltransferase family protein [candidate division KSB1 bacterium]
MKHSFHSFTMINRCPATHLELPLLLIPNHSTWWDGFFVYWLNKYCFQRQIYIMMLEKQLKKYFFFKHVGAYSIDPDDYKEIRRSLNYTLDLINLHTEPAPLVTLFPQGELLPWTIRPLNFKKGLEWIISKSQRQINLLPVVFRIEYLNQQKADVFFKFGENHVYDPNSFPGMNSLEQEVTSLLDSLQLDIINRNQGNGYHE